jgi:hypothetical protein
MERGLDCVILRQPRVILRQPRVILSQRRVILSEAKDLLFFAPPGYQKCT